jgi:hypothetical protein
MLGGRKYELFLEMQWYNGMHFNKIVTLTEACRKLVTTES